MCAFFTIFQALKKLKAQVEKPKGGVDLGSVPSSMAMMDALVRDAGTTPEHSWCLMQHNPPSPLIFPFFSWVCVADCSP